MSRREDGPRRCHGNAVRFAPRRVPRRPLAALAPLLGTMAAPLFQATTLFRRWLITVLMKCEGSGNVTRMTRACQCGPAGRRALHSDIWKDTEQQPLIAFSRKELLITSVGFYVTSFFVFIFYFISSQGLVSRSGYQADVFCHVSAD